MKNNKHGIKSRPAAFFLCLFLTAACVLSPAASMPPARAASGAVSAEASVEAVMALYSFLETCGIAGGMEKGLDDYASGKSLLDSFVDFLGEVAVPGGLTNYERYMSGTTVTLDDGTVVTGDELYQMYVEGTGALKEEDFARFRVIEGGLGGSGDPDPEKNPFSRMRRIFLGTGSALLVADFYEKLYNGELEGLDAADYYAQMYEGAYQRDAEGNYIFNGTIITGQFYGGLPAKYIFSGTVPYRPALYFVAGIGTIDRMDRMDIVLYDEASGLLQKKANEEPWYNDFPDLNWSWGVHDENGGIASSGSGIFPFYENWALTSSKIKYYLSIPVFSDYETAAAFVSGGEGADTSGMLNLRPYGIAALLSSVAGAVAPLVGTQLEPAVLPAAGAAAAAAVQTLPEPAPGSDPDANAEAYKQAVTEAVAETAPASGGEGDPVSAPETAKKYRRDLTLIFPFCLPFDLIHFFRVMNAEPVAPCFHIPVKFEMLGIDMDMELDMSFLEPAMQVFRIGEIGLFVIGLIMATSRLIRW
ncbi:MAG: hypothetical protein NC306_15140 [Butyrivibrio sp.]|nr:hypothetical protein [Butyrivibrio sp.]